MMKTGNHVVWNLDFGQAYEAYYFTTYHQPSGRAFWLRSTLLKAENDVPSERGGLWLASFNRNNPDETFASCRFFPESQVNFKKGDSQLEIGDSLLKEGSYRGAFEQDGRSFKWDLSYEPQDEELWMIPKLVRLVGINKADVCIPNVDIKLNGSIWIDDIEFKFDGIPAGQSHHWGRHYSPEWIWGHCNEFEGRPGAWLEILSAKFIKKGALEVPATMMHLNTGKEVLQVTGPLQMFSSKAGYRDGVWRYVVLDKKTRVEVEFKADPELIVKFPYVSPHNMLHHCYNSCLCDLKIRTYKRRFRRWKQTDELICQGRAAAEYCAVGDIPPNQFIYRGLVKPDFIRS